MKTILLTFTLALSSMIATAQSDFDRSTDKENGLTVFKGQFTFEDLDNESSFKWLDRGVEEYKPDAEAVKYLTKHLPEYNLIVLMGTWCDDSHNLVPKLYKTLQVANFPMSNYKMYGLDRAKETKYIEHKLYKVDRVPTVILMKNNMEIGRITENVKQSIETDLAKMIEADQGK